MKQTKYKIFFLLILIVIPILIVFNESEDNDKKTNKNTKLDDINEVIDIPEEVNYTKYYNYAKNVDVTTDYYPVSPHLCIEVTGYIYFVPFQNTLTIRKLDISTGISTLIVTEVGSITKFWHDRPNNKLYYYQSQSIVSYVDLSNDTITDLNGTLSGVDDIFVYSNSVFAVDCSSDDLTFYKYTAGTPGSWGAVGTIAEGATNSYDIGALGGNDNPWGMCWDGTYFYICDYSDGYIYKYPSNFASLTASYDISTVSSGANDNPTGLCWDGTFFYVTDPDDGCIYKYNAALNILVATYDIGALGNDNPFGICWDGTYFYTVDYVTNTVYKYPSDFSSVLTSYDLSSYISSAISLFWDGTYFYITDDISTSIFKFNSDFSILVTTQNLGLLSNIGGASGFCIKDCIAYAVDSEIEGATHYVYKFNSDLITELGNICYTTIIGTNAYLVYQYIGTSAKIYVKALGDSSNPVLLETLATTCIIPYLDAQRGIAVSSDNDTLSFVLKYSDDLKTYLCTYMISTDTFTKVCEYNISLMLERNCNSSNTPSCFALEKAFGVGSDNKLKIYQIASNRSHLYLISDLSGLAALVSYPNSEIKAITDTYLFLNKQADLEVWEYERSD